MKAEVGEVIVLTHTRTISGPGKITHDQAFILVDATTFDAIVAAESSMSRKKFNDGYIYSWHGGVMGYYWPQSGLIRAGRWAITSKYAKAIKFQEVKDEGLA